MGSQLSLTCSRCGHTSKFSGNLAQDSFVCTSCGLQIHGVQIEQFDGCVYVLSNPSMPGLLKIGMTEQDAFSRARELSSATGVPEPYVVEAYVTCRDAASIELDVHGKLAHLRKPNREFFSVSIDEAVRLLEELVGKKSDYQRQKQNYCCYATLGVQKSATEEEIKQAFRKLGRKQHPDLNPGDKVAEVRYKELCEAYYILGNSGSRRAYDERGSNWRR